MASGIPVSMKLAAAPLVDPSARVSESAGGARALTAAIARGDEAAFNLFYAEYSPRVFRLLIVVTGGDEELSLELHQHVMIKAAQRLKVFETEAELWAWLAQVARNRWKDVWRKRMREARAHDSLPLPLEKAELVFPSPWVDQLEGALEALPAPERELVESFYFEEVSQKDLARSSGRSVKAIQCALARVRRRLKEILEKAVKP
jgi:RNA polymerase sigma factor (sigma-70 family)